MSTFHGNTMSNGVPVQLDGATFTACTYIGSPLIYSGGELPVFGEGNSFPNCTLQLNGPQHLNQAVVELMRPFGIAPTH